MMRRFEGIPRALALSALATLAFAAVAAGVDPYARGGMEVTYRRSSEQAQGAEILGQDVLTSNGLPSDRPALSGYVNHWDYQQTDAPNEKPRLDVVFRADVVIPAGTPRWIRIDDNERSRTTLDGHPLRADPIPPGTHRLRIHWTGNLAAIHPIDRRNPTSLYVQWSRDGFAFEPVPLTAMRPPHQPFPPVRVGLWLGVGVLSLLSLAYFLFRSRRAHHPHCVAMSVILALGLGLRLYSYASSPSPTELSEEFSTAMNGFQLLETGVPVGDTFNLESHRGSEITEVRLWGRDFVLARPFLERPSGFDCLVGLASYLAGVEKMQNVQPAFYRLVPIALNIVALLFVLLIGRELYPKSYSYLLGGLLYATLPIVCVQARFATGDSLVAPLALAAIWCILRARAEPDRARWFAVAGTLAGVCAYGSYVGVVFVAIVVLLSIRYRPRNALVALMAAVVALAPLAAYSVVLDAPHFFESLRQEFGGRVVHWHIFPRYFTEALIGDNHTGRGFLLFLWIAFAVGGAGQRKQIEAALVVPPIVYVVALAFTAGGHPSAGDFLPIYGFLCLGAGCCLEQLLREPDLGRALPLIALGVMYGLNFLLPLSFVGHPRYSLAFKPALIAFLVIAFAPFIAHALFRRPATATIARAAGIAAIVAMLSLSIHVDVDYARINDEYSQLDYSTAIN